MKITKKIFFAVSTAVALAAGAYSMSTTAAPTYMVETTYYSNAAHTTEVGYRIRACNGRTFTSGTVTVYKEVSSEPCFFK